MFNNPLELTIMSGLMLVLGTIIWWWFQRVVRALDQSASQQQELLISIAKICGTLTSMTTWQESHTKLHDTRYHDTQKGVY